MAKSTFQNIRIAGICAASPQNAIKSMDYNNAIEEKAIEKFVAATGIAQTYRSKEKQTAADLAYAAAEKLLKEKNIDRSKIGALVFCTQNPDYPIPATAYVLHHRLGLSQDCLAMDTNQGCSAYVYGMHMACSLLAAGDAEYVLLLTGDVWKRPELIGRKNPDISSMLMTGDAASATLLQRCETCEKIETRLYSDGSGFNAIITPAGGARNRDAVRNQEFVDGNGVERTLFESYMDGTSVFIFSTSVVPKALKNFLAETNKQISDYDKLMLHQPNIMILKQIAKKLKIEMKDLPVSLDRYGNTTSASIPVTIVDQYGHNDAEKPVDLLMSGFGVGLSWGIVSAKISPKDVLPMVYTDDYDPEGDIRL